MSIAIVLSGVTSPHRLVESVKVAYGFNGVKVDLFVVARASGMASQVGVPEAYKVALKYGKPLVVLPTTREVLEHFKFDEVFLVVPGTLSGRILDDVEMKDARYALVVAGEEHAKSDVPADLLSIPELPADAPPQAVIAVALYSISRKIKTRKE
jgi:SpoU rRNA methylase family enzyme